MTSARRTEDELFEVVLYLVNSAPTSLGETPSLAAFRMLDAAHRLLAVLQRETDDQDRQRFADQARADFDEHHHLVMTDQVGFQAWMPDFVRLCTEEAMRRAGPARPHSIPETAPVSDPPQKGLRHDHS